MVHRSLTNLIGNGMEGLKHVQRGLWGMYISFLHCRCCSLIQESNFEHAMAELRTLLKRFANYKLLDIVIDAINALIDDTRRRRRDQSLREWFASVDAYMHKVFLALLLLCICAYSSLRIGSPPARLCTRACMQ